MNLKDCKVKNLLFYSLLVSEAEEHFYTNPHKVLQTPTPLPLPPPSIPQLDLGIVIQILLLTFAQAHPLHSV